jgi:hypothetical protein
MENGDQPYDDEVISEGMLKAWEGHPTTWVRKKDYTQTYMLNVKE